MACGSPACCRACPPPMAACSISRSPISCSISTAGSISTPTAAPRRSTRPSPPGPTPPTCRSATATAPPTSTHRRSSSNRLPTTSSSQTRPPPPRSGRGSSGEAMPRSRAPRPPQPSGGLRRSSARSRAAMARPPRHRSRPCRASQATIRSRNSVNRNMALTRRSTTGAGSRPGWTWARSPPAPCPRSCISRPTGMPSGSPTIPTRFGSIPTPREPARSPPAQASTPTIPSRPPSSSGCCGNSTPMPRSCSSGSPPCSTTLPSDRGCSSRPRAGTPPPLPATWPRRSRPSHSLSKSPTRSSPRTWPPGCDSTSTARSPTKPASRNTASISTRCSSPSGSRQTKPRRSGR